MKPAPPRPPERGLVASIDAAALRARRAQAHPAPNAWYGLGMMGLVGWSVALPTLAGAALGWWLERRFPAHHGWTLALLAAGLTLGCINAWRWIADEHASIDKEQNDDGNDGQ